MTYAPVRCIVSKQWNNGPYSTVDGRRLIAVANTLRALVLGGVDVTASNTDLPTITIRDLLHGSIAINTRLYSQLSVQLRS